MKPTFLIILILLFSKLIFAQALIDGSVQLEDGTLASGAFVRLMLKDSITMKKFTAADGHGHWKLKNVSSGDYLLNVSYLGTKELFYPIVVNGYDSLHVLLELESDALLLPGVKVKGDAIGITQSGDTLKFNLKYFTSGAEVSLGDVLDQLPGVEVDDDGTVKYAGKKVDKLLVQGKDILNNKHKLATESIRANQLAGIHVIQDYRDEKDIETKKSGKTALDVQIKESEQNKWSGQLKAFGGYDKKWAEDLGAFKVTTKLGATFFARANNTGEQGLSMQDYLGIKGMQIVNQLKPYGNAEDLYPKSFRIAPQTTNNLDALMAGAIDYDFNKQKSIKGDFILAQLNRDEQQSFNRSYLGSQDVWTGAQLMKSKQPILSARLLSENKMSSSLFWALGLSGNYEKVSRQSETQGFYNTSAYELNNTEHKNTWGLTPEMKIKYFLTPKIRLNWMASYQQEQVNQLLELSDITPVLGLNQLPQNGLYNFAQAKDLSTQKLLSVFRFSYDLKKAWYWGVEAKNEIGDYHKTYLSVDNQSFMGKVKLSQKLNAYKLKLVLDTSMWLIKMDLTLLDNRVRLGGERERQPVKLRPNLTLKYLFSRFHFIMLTARTDEDVASTEYGSTVLEAVGSRQSKSFDIDWQKSSRKESYALSYLNMGLGRGRMVYALVNYSIVDNPIGVNVIPHENYSMQELIRLPQQKNTIATFWYRDRVVKWLFAKAEYRLMNNNGSTASNHEISAYHRVQHHFKIGLSSKWKKKINYKLDYSLNITKQNFKHINSSFKSHVPHAQLSYHHRKSFLWKTDLTYQKSFGHSIASQNWRLDSDISYKSKGSRWRFLLKGRNLLNLVPARQVDVRFTPNYTEALSYHYFAGYVVGGLSWAF